MTAIIRTGAKPLLSRAVAHGSVVYTQGFTAQDRTLDVTRQTRQVLDAIDGTLALHGSDKSKLLQAQIWLADMAEKEAMNAAWSAWLPPEAAPSRACVQAVLGDPSVRVEIMVVAAL